MRKPFVMVSGLPASGKTTLGRRLAQALNLPFIDKDDILDQLFESKGIGDPVWRRTLSREADVIFQHDAANSRGAVLASHWHLPGMPSDSGTPADWLRAPSHRLVNVHCVCELEVAAMRFLRRQRHPGHLDSAASRAAIFASLGTLSRLAPLDIGERIEVDTSQEPNLDDVIAAVRAALGRA